MVDQKRHKCYNVSITVKMLQKTHTKIQQKQGVDQKQPFCYNNGIVSKKVVATVPVDTKRALAYNKFIIILGAD